VDVVTAREACEGTSEVPSPTVEASRRAGKPEATIGRRSITEHTKPLALVGLYGFGTWDRTVKAPEHEEVKVAFVSVRVGGVVGLNKAAYTM
jgi:hypothetical protein